MARPRRRRSAGISLGIIIALFSVVFASRGDRARVAAPVVERTAPGATVAPASRSATTTGATNGDVAPARSSPAIGFASSQRLIEHFEKHGEEFPGLTMPEYLAAAQVLRDAPSGGDVLELRRRDGVVTRFDRVSGAFLAVNRDGTIRTFFKPNDGESYFRRQASRSPGGGP
jgi:hypothetical protein